MCAVSNIVREMWVHRQTFQSDSVLYLKLRADWVAEIRNLMPWLPGVAADIIEITGEACAQGLEGGPKSELMDKRGSN